MTEATTLGEALAELDERAAAAVSIIPTTPEGTEWEGRLAVYRAAAASDALLLRRILYGTDEPCPVCKGDGSDPAMYGCADGPLATPCPTCHGTGRIRTPGVGDRLKRAFLCGDGTYDGFAVERLLEAIRREIGEAP